MRFLTWQAIEMELQLQSNLDTHSSGHALNLVALDVVKRTKYFATLDTACEIHVSKHVKF